MRAPEVLGGGGMSLLDAALVAEETGRHLAAAPVLEGIVAARLLAESAAPEASAWFERILAGQALVTLALRDAADQPSQLVPGGAVADAILYLDEDELVLRVAPPPGAAPDNLGKSR